MKKINITEAEIYQLKYLFAFYEFIAKKAGRQFVLFSKGMRCDNKKISVSTNIAEAMRENFVNRRGLVNNEGFDSMMKNAGPKIDTTLPCNTIQFEDDFFIN